jgi:hypothetical protein
LVRLDVIFPLFPMAMVILTFQPVRPLAMEVQARVRRSMPLQQQRRPT